MQALLFCGRKTNIETDAIFLRRKINGSTGIEASRSFSDDQQRLATRHLQPVRKTQLLGLRNEQQVQTGQIAVSFDRANDECTAVDAAPLDDLPQICHQRLRADYTQLERAVCAGKGLCRPLDIQAELVQERGFDLSFFAILRRASQR
ncbi:conserved hypothetical protein, partial [Ricinus communis]